MTCHVFTRRRSQSIYPQTCWHSQTFTLRLDSASLIYSVYVFTLQGGHSSSEHTADMWWSYFPNYNLKCPIKRYYSLFEVVSSSWHILKLHSLCCTQCFPSLQSYTFRFFIVSFQVGFIFCITVYFFFQKSSAKCLSFNQNRQERAT